MEFDGCVERQERGVVRVRGTWWRGFVGRRHLVVSVVVSNMLYYSSVNPSIE